MESSSGTHFTSTNNLICESQNANSKEQVKPPAGSSVQSSSNWTLIQSIVVATFVGLLLTAFGCYFSNGNAIAVDAQVSQPLTNDRGLSKIAGKLVGRSKYGRYSKIGNGIRRVAFGCDVPIPFYTLAQLGLTCVHAFTVPNPYGYTSRGAQINLGVWHMAPQTARPNCDRFDDSKQKFADGKIVLMYLHGWGGHRASRRRAEKYKTMTLLNCHLIVFDYRCFGDSTGTGIRPTKDGLVSDALAVYQWILSNGVDARRIVVWGHSLGTAVTVAMVASLVGQYSPVGAILESPFTTFPELFAQVMQFDTFLARLSKRRTFRWLVRKTSKALAKPVLSHPNTNFNSLKLLPLVRCPLLIMHAEDDKVIPFALGKKLYQSSLASQPAEVKVRPQFHAFPASSQHGHNFVYKDANFLSIVQQFITQVSRV